MVDNAALRAAVIKNRIDPTSPAYRAALSYNPGINASLAANQEQVRPYWQRLFAPLLVGVSGVQSAFAEGGREARRQRGLEEDADVTIPFAEAARYAIPEIFTGKYGSEENAFGAGAAGAWLGDEREYTGGRLDKELMSTADYEADSTANKALRAALYDFGLDPLLLPVGKGLKTATQAITKPYGKAARARAAGLQNAAPSGPAQAGPGAPVGGPPSAPTGPAPAAPGGAPTAPAPGSLANRLAYARRQRNQQAAPQTPTPTAPTPTTPPRRPMQGMTDEQLDSIISDPSIAPEFKRTAQAEKDLRPATVSREYADELEQQLASKEYADALERRMASKEARQEQAAVAQELKQTGDLADQKAADEMLRELEEGYQGPAASREYADALERGMQTRETAAAAPVTEIPKAPVAEAAAVTKTRELTAQLEKAKAEYAAAEEELAGITGRETDLTATAQEASRRIAPLRDRIEQLDTDIKTFEDLIESSGGRGAANADLTKELAAAQKARQQAVDELESITRQRDAANAELGQLTAGEQSQANKAAKKRMVAYQNLQKAQKAYDEGLAAGTPKPGIPMSLPSGATIEDALSRLGEVQDVTTATGTQQVASAGTGMFGESAREAAKVRNAGEVPPPVAVERFQTKRAQRGVVNADHQVYGTTRFPTISKAIAAVSLQFANDLRDALAKLETLGILKPRLKGYDLSPDSIKGMKASGVHHDLPYDTPADVVLADNIADMTLFAAREEQNLMRYNPLSSMVPYGGRYAQEVRSGLAPVELHTRVTVDIPNKGVTEMPYKLSGEDYWRLIEGESIEITVPYKVPGKKGTEYSRHVVTPEQVKIRARLKQEARKPSGDNKVPYVGMDEVKGWQDKALDSPKWWSSALSAGQDYMQNPGRYARAQLEEYKRMGERFKKGVDKMRKEWLSTARVATNLPEPALARAWEAASRYLEDEYTKYLDEIGRNNYSAAFLSEDTAKELAGILETAARGHYQTAEELTLAVATVKARKLTKQSIRKEEVAKHYDERAVEATAAQDEIGAAAAKRKADTARQEAKEAADAAEKELKDAQTAYDVKQSEMHQKVFDASETFGVSQPTTKGINDALDTALETEMATRGYKSKYRPVMEDGTDTIDPAVFGSTGAEGIETAFTKAMRAVRNAVKGRKNVMDPEVGNTARRSARESLVAKFNNSGKADKVETEGFYRMINRAVVATLSRQAVTYKPRMKSFVKGQKGMQFRKPTAEEIASGKFEQRPAKYDKGQGSMNYDPGLILDQLEKSAPQLLRALYTNAKGVNPLDMGAFFRAVVYKSADDLAIVRKADPELANWARQYDSLSHSEDVTNIRNNRTEIQTRADKAAFDERATKGIEEEGSILVGFALAGGAGTAAVAGMLAAGFGPEDIRDMMNELDEHGNLFMAGLVAAGTVGLAYASRGKVLRFGSRVQKNAARQQITAQAQQSAATATQQNANLTGTIGTGVPNAIPAVRIDPAFMQKEWDEKFFGLFKTNYKMRNIYGRVQNAADAVISYMNDSAIHAQRLIQLSKQDPDALGRMIPELFSAKRLDEFDGIDREVLTELRKIAGPDFYGSEQVKKYTTGNGTLHRAALDPERIVKNLKLRGIRESIWAPPKAGGPRKLRTWEDAAAGRAEYYEVIQDHVIANFDPKDPLKTLDELVKIEAGLMTAISESIMFDQLVHKFGSTVPKSGMVRITGGHPYLEGMYLDPEIVPEVQQLVGRLNKIDDFKVSNKFMASWDILNRVWKTQVTIYRPAHHVRNYVGDMFLGWVDAEGGAPAFLRDHNFAWRLLSARGGNKYVNKATGEYLPAADVVMYGRTRDYWLNPSKRGPTDAADMKIKNKSVGEINGDEILDAANDRGLTHGAPTLEDIALEDAGKGFKPLEELVNKKPFGGKVRNVGSMASVYREHSIRLTHFVNVARSVRVPKSVMQQGRQAQLDYIFDTAAQRVRKYHPDGLDMTPAERRIARRVIPFYSWMRKATPLVFNAYFFKPYAVTAYPKLTDSLSYGTIGDDERFLPEDETWTDEQLASVPWLYRRMIAPQTGVLASIGYYGPSTPFIDQTKEFLGGASTPGGVAGATAKTLAGGINPIARVPAELLTNTQFSFGTPVSREQNKAADYAQYAFEQTSGLAGEALRRTTSRSGFGHEAFNWATGAGRVDFSNSKYFAVEDTQNRVAAAAEDLADLEPSQDPAYQAWLQQMGLGPYAGQP